MTRVHLLRPGRFIVSCHSRTHRADLYHSVLSRPARPHADVYTATPLAGAGAEGKEGEATEFQVKAERRRGVERRRIQKN